MDESDSTARRPGPGAARLATLGVVALGAVGVCAWLIVRQIPEADDWVQSTAARLIPASLVQPAPPASPAPPVSPPPRAEAPAPAPAAVAPPQQTAAAQAPAAQPAAETKQAATPERPSFDIVRVAPDGTAVVAGRAAPHADIALLDNEKVIAHAKADDSGQFVVIPDKALPAGGQQLALQSDQPGAAPLKGDAPAIVVVPDRPGAAAPSNGSSANAPAPKDAPVKQAEAVAVLTPPDAAPRLLTIPFDGTVPAGQVALRVVDYDARGNIRFAGTAKPGSTVRLYIDNAAVGEAHVDSAGRWGIAPDGAVSDGKHRLRADELGDRGKVLSRAELPFERTANPTDRAYDALIVQPHQTLWRIAREVYGEGTRYTLILAANRDQIRNPNRIYPGQVFNVPPPPPAAESATAR